VLRVDPFGVSDLSVINGRSFSRCFVSWHPHHVDCFAAYKSRVLSASKTCLRRMKTEKRKRELLRRSHVLADC
jgi:hypothetical protein